MHGLRQRIYQGLVGVGLSFLMAGGASASIVEVGANVPPPRRVPVDEIRHDA